MRKHALVNINFKIFNNCEVAVIFVTAVSSCVSFYNVPFASNVVRVLSIQILLILVLVLL